MAKGAEQRGGSQMFTLVPSSVLSCSRPEKLQTLCLPRVHIAAILWGSRVAGRYCSIHMLVGDIAVFTCWWAILQCSHVGGRYCSVHVLVGDIAGFTSDVKVWEVLFDKSGGFLEVARAFELKGHSAGVQHFSFSSGSTRMATVSKDNTWKLWDTDSECACVGFEGVRVSGGEKLCAWRCGCVRCVCTYSFVVCPCTCV